MTKKILITTILLLIQISFINAQCIADAGQDKVVCVGWYGVDTTMIGGNPSAFGGTPPYTYTWEALHVINIGNFTWTFTASDFLNDTTISNPLLVQNINIEDPIEFFLTVTDSNDLICSDSVVISFSTFGFAPGYQSYNINQGDSVYLSGFQNLFGGIPPLEYLWRPNHGLTDSTSLSLYWTKPDYSIDYYLTITDSEGCVAVGGTCYEVIVTPVSVIDVEINNVKISLTPIPVEDKLRISIEPSNFDFLTFEIYNLRGQLQISETIHNSTEVIDLNHLQSGYYLYKVLDNNIILEKGKLVVK